MSDEEFAKFLDKINLDAQNKYCRREHYYIVLANNLLKKIDSHILYEDLLKGEISDDDYEKQILMNPDEYVIEISRLKERKDLEIIIEIADKIKKNLSLDEVSELFSIAQEDLVLALDVKE